MKKFLRKWLEIEEIPEIPSTDNLVTKDEVKDVVRSAVVEAFSERSQFDNLSLPIFSESQTKNIRGTFDRTMLSVIRQVVSNEISTTVRDRVEGEEFISDIVERINRNQLKGDG